MSSDDETRVNNETSNISQPEVDSISIEEQEKLLKKFEPESNSRKLEGVFKIVVKCYAIAMALYHIYTSIFGMPESVCHRAIHLLFVIPLCFLMYPSVKSAKGKLGEMIRKSPTILDCILSIMAIVTNAYIVKNFTNIYMRGGLPEKTDVIMGVILILLVLEAVRRVVGLQLTIISAIFLVYAYYGKYMPGIFAHKGVSIPRLISHLYILPEGVYSIAIGTAATYIVLFVIFAAFLEKSGMGEVIRDLAMRIAGKQAGGPAKVSVVTSALFGTISGSAAANVVTTGAFTIPLMKKTGYQPEFSGAVEAVSSTGGQLMPPIMGSAAFIMADYLGCSYAVIIMAAIIPAILYYGSVFVTVHLRAKKLGLQGTDISIYPTVKDTLRQRGHLLVPMIAVIILLLKRYTPLFCGSVGILLVILSSAIRKETRMGIKDILDALEKGAKNTISVSIACASVGCVIGVCTLTGISSILGSYVLRLSQGNVIITLVLVAIIAIIMGMGLSTTAVYILLVSIAAPILTTLGFPLLVSHFFVFYFGILANITPPVALASYAAAGLANCSPSKTGWTAFKMAIPVFLIPFMFSYDYRMLMYETNAFGIAFCLIKSMAGVVMMCIAIEGFLKTDANVFVRIVSFAGGIALMLNSTVSDIVGVAALAAVVVLQLFRQNRPAEIN